MSLVAMAAAVRAGAADPVEVAQTQLARIVVEDAALHGFVAVDAARVLGDAAVVRRRVAAGEHLSLAGVPVAVKDAFDVAGLPTTANARWFAGAPPARADSAAAARLRAAGAVILGKANCWEMSVGGPSSASPAPPAVNPWAPGADPGGSSSGSAVAVAAGLVLAATGGDTGGSIRLPAAFCGVAGFKPTHGAVPMAGSVPFAESLDVAGPIAGSAAGCAAVQAVLAGAVEHGKVGLGEVSIGVPEELLRHGNPSAAAGAAFEAALTVLARHGARVRRVALPSAPLFNACYFVVARGEAFARWKAALAARPDTFNDLTRRSFAIGAMIPAAARAEAARLRVRLGVEMRAAMAGCDVLALPTIPDEAGDLDAADAFSRPDTAPYTRPFSLVGMPGVSIPCGVGARGRPLGLQLVARRWADMRLLAIAAAAEAVLPATGMRPDKEWWR